VTAVLALLVAVGVLLVLIVRLQNGGDAVERAEQAQLATRLTRVAGEALFALDDEQGVAELWLAVPTTANRQSYRAATEATDEALAALRTAWNMERTGLEDMAPPRLEDVVEAVEILPELRAVALAAREDSTYRSYGRVADVLLAGVAAIASLVPEPTQVPELTAYVTLLEVADSYALERSLVTARIAAGQAFSGDESAQLALLEQEARIRLAAAQALVQDDTRDRILDLIFQTGTAPTEELLAELLGSGAGDPEIDTVAWFDASTARLATLREIAAEANTAAAARADGAEEDARASRTRSAVGLGILLLVAIAAGVGAVLASRDHARALVEHNALSAGLLRWFLPETFPDVAGLEIVARYVPASEFTRAGGDWYDVYPVSGDTVGITIGDVVGHGPTATAHMAELRNLLRGISLTGPGSPAAQLQTLDRSITGADTMATLLHGLLDVRIGRFVYARAGHLPGLLRRGDGSIDRLAGGSGPPVGARSGTGFHEETVDLGSGDLIVLFTDGLVEGRERTIDAGMDAAAAIVGADTPDLDVLARDLVTARPEHEDDGALLLVRWHPSPRGGPLG
jgi:hypothetical protein